MNGAAIFTIAAAAALSVSWPQAEPKLTVFRIGGGVEMPAEHGSYSVPANRQRGDSGRLVLRYVRFRSTAASPGAPIVFLAGGPGDAATRAFAGMPREFLDSLLATADVIAFDQRGTGTSEPRAVCAPAGALPLDVPLDPSRILPGMRDRIRQCLADLAKAGVDVGGLTTEQSADDVEDLRKVLGAPKLTLLAGSYGTHLAISVARRHPESIERMALFGVEGPDHTLKLPANVDAVLAEIALVHPDLLDTIETLRTRLRQQPWTKTLPNGQQVAVGEWDLQRRIAEALDTTTEIAALIGGLKSMMAGDYSDLVRWTIPFRLARPVNVMNLAMDCASFASGRRLETISAQQRSSRLGAAMNFPLPDICDEAGLPRLPVAFREPLTTRIPTLLVSGTWDGRTPPSNAKEIASTMAAAQLVTIPRASHGLFQEPAAIDALRRFVPAGTPPALVTESAPW
jgi:pimeloyl-ACP methyl ester carboxylesterase